MTPAIAVAVVSWNTRDLLRRCLEALESAASHGVAEVWVVDNASEDGSAAMVRNDFEWVSLVANQENLGFGPAVNEVASRTSTEWLAPANADIAPGAGALEVMLEAGRADPSTAIVAPRLVMPDGTTQHSVHAFPTVTLSLAFGSGLHRLVPGLGNRLCIEGYWDASSAREVDWAHGAFLLVRRSAFDEVGGFDPEQWMYAEDLDLAWRCARSEWKVRYEPSATVAHEVSAATQKAFGADRVERYMAATYAWMAERRGMAVTWAFAAVNTVAAGLRWLAFAALARTGAGRFVGPCAIARAYARIHARGLRTQARLKVRS